MNEESKKLEDSKAWPIVEAKRVWERINGNLPAKGYVLFETGYGPSGLPHIGTFAEVARTTMVCHAFETLYNMPTRLIAFSDDLDGLRKVPDNIPNQEMVRQHLGKALTSIPDPFGSHPSYGHHMNARLCAFLDAFAFKYEFRSATTYYNNGEFDQALLKVLEHYEEIMEVMLPTLGEERQSTYSPFLPICPKTGIVLQVPIISLDKKAGTITYKNSFDEEVTTLVTGGRCKLQWKVDWAMRWYAQEVDFEMHGKDLIPSAELSSKICHILGKEPPVLYKYELFLDDKGQKISKSKGNGLTVEDWLRYAPHESLALFMYNSPNKAKKLYFDIIPKQVDEYIIYLNKYKEGDFDNPLWHLFSGKVSKEAFYGLSFSLLLNLASVCNPEDKTVLWGFISKYAPESSPATAPFLDRLADYAVLYYRDFILPHKKYRTPSVDEQILLQQIANLLKESPDDITAEEIQNKIYEIGRNSGIDLKEFFQIMYEILLGQEQGPRLGSFFQLYGIKNTIKLIEKHI